VPASLRLRRGVVYGAGLRLDLLTPSAAGRPERPAHLGEKPPRTGLGQAGIEPPRPRPGGPPGHDQPVSCHL